MGKHSPIGASSMYRWSKCPGSVKKSEGIESAQSIYATIGSMAHETAAYVLDQMLNNGKSLEQAWAMLRPAVDVYLNHCESLKSHSANWHIEHMFDMGHIFKDLWGTADFVSYDFNSKVLHVVDYKHGEGIPVEAENNLQLSYYALGALSTLNYRPLFVSMEIVQPRCYHPQGFIRKWQVPVIYFLEFKAKLIKAAKETNKKNAKLLAGDHCVFCAAKKICKKYGSRGASAAKKEFKFYKDPKKEFQPIDEPVDFKPVNENGFDTKEKILF